MPGAELEAPALGKQLDKSTVGGAEAPQEPTLQLTYAQLGKRIGRSPDAVRTLVARRHLPRTIGGDGKALVTISQGILDQLQSDQSPGGDPTTRSPGGDLPITDRSSGDDRVIAEGEAASPPAVNPLTLTDWLPLAVKAHVDADDVPDMISIFAQTLYNEAKAAYRDRKLGTYPTSAASIQTMLYKLKLWRPPKSLKK
jgi:hypothetical protein